MSKWHRREFLRSASAAASLALFPPSIRRALAIPANVQTGTIQDVKHVVIFMQENRSFDHYFGTLRGVRGFGDPVPIPLPDGQNVWFQSDGSRTIPPFHLNPAVSSALLIDETPHTFPAIQAAWNQGIFGKWPYFKTDNSMGYYKRADIPYQFALAEAFTICDAYHCSVMGPTWPNRMYLMTGMIDPDGRGGGPILKNTAPDGGYTWTTYPERLQAAGVSWKVYEQQDSYGCNMLKNFKVFQQAQHGSALYAKGMQVDPEGQFEYDAMH